MTMLRCPSALTSIVAVGAVTTACLLGLQAAHAESDVLSAVPVADGIVLTWPPRGAIAGTRAIWRWEDGEPPVRIGIAENSQPEFVDRTTGINRLYHYRIDGVVGAVRSVRSRIDEPFHCPAVPPVPPEQLGVDRTETFMTPTGRRVSFTIRAPQPRAMVVTVPRCGERADCSDRTNIADAIAKVITAGGGRVQLEAGTYDIRPPDRADIYAQLDIANANDLVLAGAGMRDGVPATVLRFDARLTGEQGPGKLQALTITGSNRVLVRDIAVDWSRPTALPGRAFDAGDGMQRFVVDDAAYYIPDPANPPVITNINGYDHARRTYILKPWSRSGFAPGSVQFNPDFASDRGYHYLYRGRSIPSGSPVIGIVRTGSAIRLAGGSSDVSFEGVHIWSGGGAGFVFGPNGRGFRITNSRITRKPDSLLEAGERPRLISLRGDSAARNTRGEVLIENSEFAFTEDDGFNIVGSMVQGSAGTEIISASEIAFSMLGWNPFSNPPADGDILLLSDPKTLRPISREPARIQSRSMTYDPAAKTFSFRFKLAAEVPELLAYQGRPLKDLPFLADPRHASAPFVLRRNCLRDSAGGRFVVQSGPGLIEANVTANTGSSGIELSANPVNWREGPAAQDIIVRDNVVIGAGYWLTDYNGAGHLTGLTTGWLAGAGISVNALDGTGFVAKGAPNAHVRIENNLVVHAPGLGILVSSASNVAVIGNIVVNANSVPFAKDYDALYCGAKSRGYQREGVGQPWCLSRSPARGSILVTHVENATVSGNRLLGTSAAVVVDPPAR
jgi:Right handed beta helix region